MICELNCLDAGILVEDPRLVEMDVDSTSFTTPSDKVCHSIDDPEFEDDASKDFCHPNQDIPIKQTLLQKSGMGIHKPIPLYSHNRGRGPSNSPKNSPTPLFLPLPI